MQKRKVNMLKNALITGPLTPLRASLARAWPLQICRRLLTNSSRSNWLLRVLRALLHLHTLIHCFLMHCRIEFQWSDTRKCWLQREDRPCFNIATSCFSIVIEGSWENKKHRRLVGHLSNWTIMWMMISRQEVRGKAGWKQECKQ
jgi:hypothetical protein